MFPVRQLAPAALAAIAFALAACGHSDAPATDPAPTTVWANSSAMAQGAFVGQCGALADADIAAATNVGDLHLDYANAMRCHWLSADVGITFSWFRGSPLDTHAVDHGTKTRIDLSGRTAYMWSTLWTTVPLCEVAASSGGGDFISWSVGGSHPGIDPCQAAQRLTTLTLGKVAG